MLNKLQDEKVGRSQKAEISLIDWGGKVVGAVGLLGMAAYIAGYFKFYFYYGALNCSWVLGMHSVQDVIVNGAIDVVLCSLTAVPLFFTYQSSLDIDNNGRRIVGFLLLGVIAALAIGIHLLDYKLSLYASDLMTYSSFYLIYGVSVATVARYSAEERSYQYLIATFLGFVFATVFSSFLANDQKTFALIEDKGGFPYNVIGDGGVTSVLVGTVNGKYLLHVCGEGSRFKLVSPSEKWTVSKRGAEACSATKVLNDSVTAIYK